MFNMDDAAFALRTHAHGDLWFHEGGLIHINKLAKHLQLVLFVQEIWDEHKYFDLSCAFAKLNYRLSEHPKVISIRETTHHELLSNIKKQAQGNAIYDEGLELFLNMANKYKIAFDCVRKRPGCVNLQACMGGNVPKFSGLFPAETWLVTHTQDMKVYPVEEWQLEILVKMALSAVKTETSLALPEAV